MAILFERNGDWPDTDEDYRNIFETPEEEQCFFCNRPTGCICDEVYDYQQELEVMAELDELDNDR